MDQKKAAAGKRKRKPKDETAVAGKRSRRRGAVEPQQQPANAAPPVAAVVQKVAECMQSEEEEYTGITEESMAQMMSWLALELAAVPPVPPPAGYITLQGDVESCGPSFSGSASTVMASVDFGFVAPVPPVAEWPMPEAVEWPMAQAAPGPPEEVADDDWVATLLTDGPAGEEQY